MGAGLTGLVYLRPSLDKQVANLTQSKLLGHAEAESFNPSGFLPLQITEYSLFTQLAASATSTS